MLLRTKESSSEVDKCGGKPWGEADPCLLSEMLPVILL